jgi:hypothetical protein
MRRVDRYLWTVLTILPGALCVAAERPVDYVRDVAPIFEHRCVTCHGALKQSGGLRLDAGVLARKGGESGAFVTPGDAAASHLIEAVTGDLAVWRMPPEGKPLTADEIETLRRWITQGAVIPNDETIPPRPEEHWFFHAPLMKTAPEVADPRFTRSFVDRWLAARWNDVGLVPQAPADSATWLRRVTFDLTGLPPTREELSAFRADDRPETRAAVVDRLLASPAYGERWGRHWLDIWRYTDPIYDTSCQQGGLIVAEYHMWRYRDWLIHSLNADDGYDRLVQAMLAGDELAPGDPRVAVATGYLTRSRSRVGDRDTFLQDVTEHTTQAFLGLTFRCARCHDHKYDPISQADYYHFRNFFEPMEVRLDPLPGGGTARESGFNMVYDTSISETFLYKNGSPMQPDKERGPLSPQPPAILGLPLGEIQPVDLPATVFYPGHHDYVRETALQTARQKVTDARHVATNLSQAPAEGAEPLAPEELARKTRLADAEVRRAEQQLAAVEAVLAADAAERQARDDAKSLAETAGHAQRRRKLIDAELELLKAQVELERLESPRAEGEPAVTMEQLATAREKLEPLRRKIDEARTHVEQSTDDYERLTPRYLWNSTGRRTALARWMTDRRNPATARVAVNHVWLRHFGAPLVSTVFEFGRNGRAPTHPELLDALAVDFMEHGWSLKHLHRRLVLSEAYALSSARRPGHPNEARDPDNKQLWRMNARRLEAEAIRDAAWALGPGLNREAGGPPIPIEQADQVNRRSLYLNHTVDERALFLRVFDSANPDECYRREDSVAPHQALALANSEFMHRMAEETAAKLSTEVGTEDARFVMTAFEHVLSRSPTSLEQSRCVEFLTSMVDGEPVDAAVRRASLLQVLFNHTDFITLR